MTIIFLKDSYFINLFNAVHFLSRSLLKIIVKKALLFRLLITLPSMGCFLPRYKGVISLYFLLCAHSFLMLLSHEILILKWIGGEGGWRM